MCCVHLMAFINHIHEFLSEATDAMQFFRDRARARARTVDKYARMHWNSKRERET